LLGPGEEGAAIAECVLGLRWARDRADDKKATLATALERVFDPAGKTGSIALDQAARNTAAAWLPPGITAGDTAAESGDGYVRPDADLDPEEEPFGASSRAPMSREPWVELAEANAASANLPAFLSGEKVALAEPSEVFAD
jgi:hypothetical protein